MSKESNISACARVFADSVAEGEFTKQDKENLERLLIKNVQFRNAMMSLKAAYYYSYAIDSDSEITGGEWLDCISAETLCSWLKDDGIYTVYIHSGQEEKFMANCNSPEEAIGMCEEYLVSKKYTI